MLKTSGISNDIIETERLLLTVLTPEDIRAGTRNGFTDELRSIYSLNSPEAEQRFRARFLLNTHEYYNYRFFVLNDKETGLQIGSCNFHFWLPAHARAEIGYSIGEQWRGKGLMTEAAKHVLSYGFESMNLNRIEAFVGPANEPSLRLVAHFGFTREGLLRQHYHKDGRIEDSVCFSLLKQEYDQIKHSW